MTPQRCPFCDALPETRGRHYYRCPDIECAGHHWTTERKWNKRAISIMDRALQDVMEALAVWEQQGETVQLIWTLRRLRSLLQHEKQTSESTEKQELDGGSVPMYGFSS